MCDDAPMSPWKMDVPETPNEKAQADLGPEIRTDKIVQSPNETKSIPLGQTSPKADVS